MMNVRPWWDKIAKKMRITVKYETGTGYFHVYSPERPIHGFRKYFGWRVMMLGAWIMFGHRREWTSYVNCEKEDW